MSTSPLLLATIADLFKLIAAAMQDAVKEILSWCLYIIAHSPEPDLTALWYRSEYHLMLQISGYLTVTIVMVATIAAVLKGGLKEVLRTFLVGIPVSLFGAVAAIAFISILQKVDQDMTNAMMSHTTQYFDAFFKSLDSQDTSTGKAIAEAGEAILEIILFFFIFLATLVLWVELVFRQVMLYMAILFVPLGFAAFVWPPIRGWLTGITEIVVTMIFSKFIIACVMSFGFLSITQFQYDTFGQAMATFIGGLITIFVACFASPVLIIFVMQPRHDMLTRNQVTRLTPFGADRSYARGAVKGSLAGIKNSLPGGNKVPGGPVSG